MLWWRITLVMLESLAWAGLGVFLLWLTLPSDYLTHSPDPQFSRRWDGGCLGWTQRLALMHVTGDLLTWWRYVLIAIAVRRLHPTIHRIKSSWITVHVITLIFVTCGGTHLLEAYATFYPAYRATGAFKMVAAGIGITGAIMVAHNLIAVFDLVLRDRQRLQDLETKFQDMLSEG